MLSPELKSDKTRSLIHFFNSLPDSRPPGVMEPVQGTPSNASTFASDEDIISSMPEDVITNIMGRLGIKEAVRTSMLSRDWRFKWTLLTQLTFDSKFFDHLSNFNHDRYYGRIIVSRLLLHLKGSLTKFVLEVSEGSYFEDINSWIMFLSNKGIDDFTLENRHTIPLKLPTHLFSFMKLKHLELQNCCICPTPGFSGFPNLLSLIMWDVSFANYQCGEFLTRSPLLELLEISYDTQTGVMQHVELAKLENLKELSLPLCKLQSMASSRIVQLMADFSKLQELTLNFLNCKLLAGTEARKNVRTTLPLPCLKALTLCNIDFSSGIMVSCAIELICGSSKLHKLDIMVSGRKAAHKMAVVPPPVFCSSVVDDSRMQLQLQEVNFEWIGCSENEACFIKFLLSSSPFLNKMWIHPKRLSRGFSYNHEEMMFSIQLLKFHRASPLAEAYLHWLPAMLFPT